MSNPTEQKKQPKKALKANKTRRRKKPTPTYCIDDFSNLMKSDAPWFYTLAPNSVQSGGKVEGRYLRVDRPLNRDDWRNHLNGQKGLTLLLHRADQSGKLCMVSRAALDVDKYDEAMLGAILTSVERQDIRAVVTRTKSGGAHVHLFFGGLIEADRAQRLSHRIASALGLESPEVFPKQTEVSANGNRGNGLNLPYYGDTRSAVKLEDGKIVDLPLPEFLGHAQRNVMTLEDLEQLEQRLGIAPGDEPEPSERGKLYSIKTGELVQGVGEGARDKSIWVAACRLRREGFSEEFAKQQIVEMAENCDPPFDTATALEKVTRAYAKLDPADGFTNNTAGIVRHFVRMYGAEVRHDTSLGVWFIWNGRYWSEDRRNEAFRLMEHCIGVILDAADSISDANVRQAHIYYCKRSLNVGAIRAALDHASRHDAIALTGDEWDQVPDKLPCANGVINLATGELEDGRPADYLTQASPVAYDPDAKAPRWERFLDEVFQGVSEVLDFVQRALGYSITGSGKEEKFFLLSGDGSNGKSKLLEAVAMVLGDYAVTVPMAALEGKSSPGAASPDLAMLRGKRFATCSETQEGAAFNEAKVKAITGRDTITARRLYGHPFSFAPTHVAWIATNEHPSVRDMTLGFWRRILVIKFDAVFASEEEIASDPLYKDASLKDEDLPSKFEAEAPGMLTWLLRGTLSWREEGLNPPRSVRTAVEEYQTEQDTVAEFMAEHVDVTGDDADRIRAGDFQKRYTDWATSNGTKPLTKVAIGRYMKKRFRHEGGRVVHYIGLRWIEPDESESQERSHGNWPSGASDHDLDLSFDDDLSSDDGDVIEDWDEVRDAGF